jgi:hypothetical protein
VLRSPNGICDRWWPATPKNGTIHTLRSVRLRSLFGRRAMRARIEEEMRLHVEMREDSFVQAGSTPAEARRRARREFGNIAVLKESVADVWKYGTVGPRVDCSRRRSGGVPSRAPREPSGSLGDAQGRLGLELHRLSQVEPGRVMGSRAARGMFRTSRAVIAPRQGRSKRPSR